MQRPSPTDSAFARTPALECKSTEDLSEPDFCFTVFHSHLESNNVSLYRSCTRIIHKKNEFCAVVLCCCSRVHHAAPEHTAQVYPRYPRNVGSLGQRCFTLSFLVSVCLPLPALIKRRRSPARQIPLCTLVHNSREQSGESPSTTSVSLCCAVLLLQCLCAKS